MKRIVVICILLIITSTSIYIMKKDSYDTSEDNIESIDISQSNETNSQNTDSMQNSNAITEINESQYIGFINDLFENPIDYEGDPFRLSGHYRTRKIDGEVHHFIYKGTDERWVGLEITYEGEYPTEGSIIQVVGIIQVDPTGKPYIHLSSMTLIK